jgi:hypothetical protein
MSQDIHLPAGNHAFIQISRSAHEHVGRVVDHLNTCVAIILVSILVRRM